MILFTISGFSQSETSTWKGQLALGVNSPSTSGFVSSFEAKPINFPTINLGIQRMFSRSIGAKLDFSYNRISHASNSPEFKLNYSRINGQFVYDGGNLLSFLPPQLNVVGHAGPGFTFVKPLGDYTENNTSFFNVMAGIKIHYAISQTFSVYVDTSYIYGFGKDFSPLSDGFASFNGNLLTATVGVSLSLSGCYYCE